jgi:hypothetical protein
MEAKGCDSSTLLIHKKLQIEKRTTSTRESAQNVLPTSLILVAMRKLHMNMLKRERIWIKLFESNDNLAIRYQYKRAF